MILQPVFTIAGSDSSGGAGIQADLKTITMLGCYGMSAVTALTAQNTMGVKSIYPIPAAFLQEQIEAVCVDIVPAAVKIGMVYDIPQIHAIAEMIQKYQLRHVVLDPVMAATSGDSLLTTRAEKELQEKLFPLAELITPNLPEAERMTGMSIQTTDQMEVAAKQLVSRYHTAVLLKGGHCAQNSSDCLCTADQELHWFLGKRIQTIHTHGTGCTLSSAIAAYLAQGYLISKSVRFAKRYLTNAIQAGLALGHGHGPIAHNYCITQEP